MQVSIETLLSDYRDLAPPTCLRLNTPPNPLEMLRIIHAGRPVIFPGFSPERKTATQRIDWKNTEALSEAMGERKVSIAVTPNGLADALHTDETTGKTYFVQPLTENMSFSSFFERLADASNHEVHYLQSQNGNIYRSASDHPAAEQDNDTESEETPELAVLQQYIEPEVEFMSKALGQKPDAVNLWIGDSKSITSLHKGQYENIYHLLNGSKTFRLFAPVEGYLMNTAFYPAATYTRSSGNDASLQIQPDPAPTYSVPWVSVDPLNLPQGTPLRPVEVTVEEGWTLYLPAGWYHHVMQEEGQGGICVAVNYWYDQTIQAGQYALDRYVWRSLGRQDLLGERSENGESESDYVL
ncbi:hypothetical protein NCC49_005397 [Naganishia albida]|nr:hypothetical protein NCC49_005397 [Naganishia albida]